MIVSVVINEAGDILAMGPAEDVRPEGAKGAPTHHAFVPLAGQRVVAADLPDDLNTEEHVLRLYESHRVEAEGERATFVAGS